MNGHAVENLFSRSIHTYLQGSRCINHTNIRSAAYAASHISFTGCEEEKVAATRTEAELTVQIDTAPGANETPADTSVAVELVVYMFRDSTVRRKAGSSVWHTTLLYPQRKSLVKLLANRLPAP
jgi:predicted component of type VI protein secretion system